MRWISGFVWCFFLCGLGGIAYGCWGIYAQERQIRTSQPIPATVTGQRTETQKAKGFVLHMPVIQYEYTVKGRRYSSDVTYPADDFGRKQWAEDFLKDYPVGKAITVYVSPDDPSQAFLIPHRGSDPYLAVLVCIVVACMGYAGVDEFRFNNDAPPPRTDGTPATQLIPRRGREHDARLTGWMAVIGLVLGAPAWIHYLLMNTPPAHPLFMPLTVCFNVAGIGFAGRALWTAWTRRGFGQPQLETDSPQLCPGRPFQLRLVQSIQFRGVLQQLTLRVILEKKNKALFDIAHDSDKPDPVIFSLDDVVAENMPVNGNEMLEHSMDILLPDFLSSSTPPDSKEKWHYVWSVQLRGKADGLRRLEEDYVLDVTEPPE